MIDPHRFHVVRSDYTEMEKSVFNVFIQILHIFNYV